MLAWNNGENVKSNLRLKVKNGEKVMKENFPKNLVIFL